MPGLIVTRGNHLPGLIHPAVLCRSCATHIQGIQAHLRHAQSNVTAEVYMQAIPEKP
jgi:hypothetical protein